MSATNVTQLIHRLEDLLQSLERFDTELDGDFASLEANWSRVDSVWAGKAYEEFVSSWNTVRSMIQEYISNSKTYEAFLRERIEVLRRFERSGGLS